MYDYLTPDGYGDSFFVYTVNGEDIPIVNGGSYTLLGITVDDAMFVFRVWSGAVRLLAATGTVQIYDGVKNAWFQLPILQTTSFPPAMAVLPEKVYCNNTSLRFDLTNTELATNTNGTASVYADQMAFTGVKRIPNGPQDPQESLYKYYEKPFAYPIQISLTNYGPSDGGGNPIPGLAVPTQYLIEVFDYDFELREIIMSAVAAGGAHAQNLFASEAGAILVVANVPGVGGNSITVQFVVAGNNTPFSVTVIANAITVNLATDFGGNSDQNTGTIVNQMNATPALAALVSATNINNPLAPFQAFALTPLSGGSGGGGVSPYASPFKINLYDATWRLRNNIPLLAEFLCKNVSGSSPVSNAPNNVWPSPPMMYQVNSVIRFDIFSLIPTGDALPVTVNLLFNGVRRISC